MVNKGMRFTSATVGCKISSILSTTKELTTNRSSPLAKFCEAMRFVVKQWNYSWMSKTRGSMWLIQPICQDMDRLWNFLDMHEDC